MSHIVSETPKDALASLDSIDRSSLTQSDRNFYDLMRIKALDKMYIPHTADSTILKITDYYSKDKKSPEYFESIYYCGRVYEDMGDYPTAMKYYQDGIDLTEGDKEKFRLEMRGKYLAQLEQILAIMHLYKERLPYLSELIRVDSALRDTVNIVYDYYIVGQMYIHLKEYDEAEKWLLRGKRFSGKFEKSDALINMYLGAVKYHKGDYENALKLMRPNIEKVDTFLLSAGYHYMAAIYHGLEKYDSMYLYAKKLISRTDPTNKKNGYKLLLSPELKDYVNKDSAYEYIFSYRQILDREIMANTNKAAIIQDKQYNYSKHDQARQKAEKDKHTLVIWLCIAVIFILIITIGYLYQVLKSKRQIIMLHALLGLITYIEKKVQTKYDDEENLIDKKNIKGFIDMKPIGSSIKNGGKEDKNMDNDNYEIILQDEEDLREKLQRKILAMQECVSDVYNVPSKLCDTTVYKKLTEAISNGESVERDKIFWKDLEDAVLNVSKDFMRNLTILLGGKVKEHDRHVALLVKCGISPSEMVKLLNKEKGTISYRRTALGKRAFDKKMETKMVDKLIRLL
ncbi:MAG: hypothetical protein HDS95_05475 [Bacteroidales bacterium]|nr:hypothetical protein [Bacteroidales bacterium]